MADLTAPWLTASAGILFVAAAATKFQNSDRHARTIGVTGCAASMLFCLQAVRELAGTGWNAMSEPGWALFNANALNAVTMVLFVFLALITLVTAPRREGDRHAVSGTLTMAAGTLIAYASADLPVFLAGWVIVSAPYLLRGNMEVIAATTALAIGVILQAFTAPPMYLFAVLAVAASLRSGLLPFHAAAVSRFEKSPLGPTGLLMNAQLGAFLLVRFAIPGSPEAAGLVTPWLCLLALLTAIYAAVRGMVEHDPRRLLALIFVSQSSAIFAGLVTARAEGIMGGLVQWIVLGITSTLMICVYRSIEARLNHSLGGVKLLGLAAQMPRLAVCFAVSAFALVGLPGTLGFPGEDLLIHGVLSARPVVGMLLPVAIALNAYHLYRLFSRLFLGAPVASWTGAPDALPRERFAFSACLILLVLGGLLPSYVVALRSTAMELLLRQP